MESERRRSKRINIDVTIQLKSVNQNSSADRQLPLMSMS